MGIFGFGDNSDYKLHVHPGQDGRWYWTLLDGLDQVRAVPAFHGGPIPGSLPMRKQRTMRTRSSRAWR